MMPLHVGVQATDNVPIRELERRAEGMNRAFEEHGKQVAHITAITSSPPHLVSIVTPPDKGPYGDGINMPHLHFVETKGLLKVTVEFDDPEFYERIRGEEWGAFGLRVEVCERLGMSL